MKWDIDKVDIMYFTKALKRGHVIVQTLKNMIDSSEVPDTFLYMAMVESKFLTSAKSPKRAAGLWQFMPQTAKELDLTINSRIDERLDPVKSTEVAIKYLQYLHKRFGKWYLAALAYNCGETRLSKAIRQSGSDDIFVLLSTDPVYLPKETRLYIRKLLVTSLIAHSDTITQAIQESNLTLNDTKLKTLHVKKGTSLRHIASQYDIPVKTLKQYNAHILKGVTPKGHKKYCIYIPEDKINKERSICSTNKHIFTYTVQSGDTLSLISKRFNNKISAIKRLNKSLGKTLAIGKKIALIGHPKKTLITQDVTFEKEEMIYVIVDEETTSLSLDAQGIHETTQVSPISTQNTPLYENNKSKITTIEQRDENHTQSLPLSQ